MAKKKEKERNPHLEYLDPTPVHIPGKTDQPPPLSLREEMQRYIRQQVSLVAEQNKMESFEEADDFEVEDEDSIDLVSEYTVIEMEPVPGSETLDGEPTSEDLSRAEPGLHTGPTETEAAPPEGDHGQPQAEPVTST